MPELEKAVRDLQDSLIVIAEIERRQSALLREHSERIVSIEGNFARIVKATAEIQEIQKHGDERLNALITIVDGVIRNRPQQ
jgi:phosphoribosyl-dephospho-CoA transferase